VIGQLEAAELEPAELEAVVSSTRRVGLLGFTAG
jgi:hypothetical protein